MRFLVRVLLVRPRILAVALLGIGMDPDADVAQFESGKKAALGVGR